MSRPAMVKRRDSDSEDGNPQQREEAHIKRLVVMAKQQQSLMTAWFAASSGKDVGDALPPRRPRPVSRQSSRVSSVSSTPVDLDSIDEDAASVFSSSGGGSSKIRSFLHLMLPKTGTPSTTQSKSVSSGSETVRVSNLTDVEHGIPVGASNGSDDHPKWTSRRIIGWSLGIILVLAILTVVVSVVLLMQGRGSDDSDIPVSGQTTTSYPPWPDENEMPTNAPTSTMAPSAGRPSKTPTTPPSLTPTKAPTFFPTAAPSFTPTALPSASPSVSPTRSPAPSTSPTQAPTSIFSTSEFNSLMTLRGDQVSELFGYTVAMSGDGAVMAVGAPNYADQGLSRSGRVQVFELANNQWQLMGQTLLGRNDMDQFGLAIALSEDGSQLAVSEPGFDGPAGDRSGNVRVFDYDGTEWTPKGQEIGGEAIADLFGLSLALSGNGTRLAVGSPYHDNDNDVNLSGRVRVLQLKGNSWQVVGEALDGSQSLDWFGWSVDMSFDGDVLAVGAPRNTEHGGYVRCFEWSKGAWKQAGLDIVNELGDIKQDDRFGLAVSLSPDGKRVAVGSPWKDLGRARSSGLVAVYELTDNEWSVIGEPFEGLGSNYRLGWDLQLSDEYLTIGVPGMNQVSFHQWTGFSWDTVTSPLQGDEQGDEFGYSVASSKDGKFVIVGATESSQGDSGYVRVLQRQEP